MAGSQFERRQLAVQVQVAAVEAVEREAAARSALAAAQEGSADAQNMLQARIATLEVSIISYSGPANCMQMASEALAIESFSVSLLLLKVFATSQSHQHVSLACLLVGYHFICIHLAD